MKHQEVTIIGELMNNSYLRARNAWQARSIEGYQELAKLQEGLGASYLTLNMDGTQKIQVELKEMIDFLAVVVPALQAATSLPISFDNPHIDFHRAALRCYDRSKVKGRPILNSVAVSRTHSKEMMDLAKDFDMNIIVMASECERKGSHGPCLSADDVVRTTVDFVRQLQQRGIENDRVIVDPGLAPVASDTTGLINLCLDSIRSLRAHPELQGIHISVGLSNFAIGAPKPLRIPLECAFLRLAVDSGMDWALANPEKNTKPLEANDPLVLKLKDVLQAGRVKAGEKAEDAGFRQLDELMEIWSDEDD